MRRLLGLALVAALGGCFGSPTGARVEAPSQPTELAKCKVAAGQENPLVTEWPASEKANLEARLREQGGVVVAYSGCAMKLLPGCRVPGAYGWRHTTTSTDTVEIHNADELYAKMPLGALSLEGELERAGRIAVQTTVSGQFELRGWDKSLPTDPACNGATHVLGALSVGSFKLRSGASLGARGSAGVSGVGSGSVSTQSSENVLREAGSPDACKQATADAPNSECGSPVQVFLWALPKELADRGPPGTVKVNFISATPDRTWDVVVNDRVLCKTPCERWVDPAIPFGFRYERGLLQRDERVELPDLRETHDKGPLLARAHPRSDAGLVGGIVLTTFGGLGILTGGALMGVGCASSDKSLCTAGAIVTPIGVGMLIPGILLMVKSAAYAEVTGGAP